MFLAHIFENIGMCIGLTPVIGLTLPFISYGGSSLISLFAMLGGMALPFFSFGGTAIIVLLAEMGVVLSVSRKSSISK